ncbi:sialidase family protein [Streptobacillus moniliformis]|uniref:sialidase family protein n=1 Tax=Streptobacillus moniliformis TaxID=34105 RepID=UPI0007E478EB|nr:sialidase family protein [Streptobacillus moniliformis]
MNKKLLLMFSIIALQLLNASTKYNDGFFDDFKSRVNLTKVKHDTQFSNNQGIIGENGNEGKWAGVGPNGEPEGTATLLYTRIPSMIITNDNKLIVMYDLRWQDPFNPENPNKTVPIGNDHGRIDQGISISEDGGNTWERTHKFDKNNNDIFVNHTPDNPVRAFLGGVGTGIVMRDGTLVMPIQTSHQGAAGKKGIAATIMYSRDNGKTWKMPKNNDSTIVAPNQQSLENMVFEMGNKLVLAGRGGGNGNNLHRWAYYTEDMGKTWNVFEPLHLFQSVSSQPSQGSTLYVTLPSGKKVILVSAPKGNRDGYKRADITLYALSGKDKNQMQEIAIIKPGSGNGLGDGYSSLAYKGGNLFVAYEDMGDISVKNLTEHIAKIEELATSWNLEDERAKDIEKVQKLDSLTPEQKDSLTEEMMKDNDRAFTEAIVLNNELKDLDQKAEKYYEDLYEIPDALPSNIENFNRSLEKLWGNERNNLLKVMQVRMLKHRIDNAESKINEKIDFEPYKEIPKKFIYIQRDIVNNDDDVFAILGKKIGVNEKDFKFGFNHSIDNRKIGAFLEINKSKDKAKNVSIGTTFKTEFINYVFRNFVRYRHQSLNSNINNNKPDAIISDKIIRHNLETYSSIETKFNANKNISIIPKAGILLTYSHDSLLDMNVRLDRRVSASADFSVKTEFKYKKLKFKIKPEILVNDNTLHISQSNLSKKKLKIDNKIFEYNMKMGMVAKLSKINIGMDLNISDISRDYTNYELNFGAGYNW